MDPADLAARERLLADPLRSAWCEHWPSVPVDLDAAAAVQRPGEPLALSWSDGPAEATVAGALAPGWSTQDNPPGHAYPVRLHRRYSLTVQALVLLELDAAGTLESVADAGRHALAGRLTAHLHGRDLPAGAVGPDLARAELLAQIAETAVGRDAFAWACWLSYGGGRHVLTHVLPGALEDTAPPA